MKKILLWSFPCFLIVVCLIFQWPLMRAEKEDRPHGPVFGLASEASYDFGLAKPDEVIEHSFKIQNQGGADLAITDLVPGCGCTNAEAIPSVIPPGESGEIRVRYTARGSVAGRDRIQIVLKTNDPAFSATILQVTGMIDYGYSINPSALSIESLNGKTVETPFPVHIGFQSGSSPTLKGLETSAEGLTGTIEQVSELDWIFRISVGQGLETGLRTEYAWVNIDFQGNPTRLAIPLHVHAR